MNAKKKKQTKRGQGHAGTSVGALSPQATEYCERLDTGSRSALTNVKTAEPFMRLMPMDKDLRKRIADDTSTTCEECGYNRQDYTEDCGLTFAECDQCGWLCDACLKRRAITTGLMTENDANLVYDASGADGYIMETESGDAKLCADCFVAREDIE
jgi:hypothetical protein